MSGCAVHGESSPRVIERSRTLGSSASALVGCCARGSGHSRPFVHRDQTDADRQRRVTEPVPLTAERDGERAIEKSGAVPFEVARRILAGPQGSPCPAEACDDGKEQRIEVAHPVVRQPGAIEQALQCSACISSSMLAHDILLPPQARQRGNGHQKHAARP